MFRCCGPYTTTMASTTGPALDKPTDTEQMNERAITKELDLRRAIDKCMEEIRVSGVVSKSGGRFDRSLTVAVDIVGVGVTAMSLITNVNTLCGTVSACRCLSRDRYEISVLTEAAKAKLLDGL